MNEKQKMFQWRRVLQYTADYCSGVHCVKIALWGRVLYLWESALYHVGACIVSCGCVEHLSAPLC